MQEVVEKFEMLYSARTGLTVLLAPIDTLDVPVSTRVFFRIDQDALLIEAQGRTAALKKVAPQHLEQATRHGVVMFYEMRGDNIVRCTPCYKS